MSFCTNCGSELEPGARFCTKCGAKAESPFEIPEEPVPQPGPSYYDMPPAAPPQAPKKSPLVPILLGVLGAMILGAGVFIGGSRIIRGHFPWESEKSAKEDREDKDEDKESDKKKGASASPVTGFTRGPPG